MNNKKTSTIILYTVLTLLLILTLYPFIIMIMGSFKHQTQLIKEPWFFSFPLHFSNYGKAFSQIASSIINSLIITTGVIAGTITVSSLASYAFMRFDFFGKKFLYIGIIALLMIPGFVILIPQFVQVKSMGLYNTLLAQILPPIAIGSSMATHLTTTFFKAIPKSLIEAAEIEGAGELTIFAKMIIPLSRSILATVAIITGLNAWNNYIWPLVITSGDKVRPVVVSLTLMTSSMKEGQGVFLAGYVIASIPIILLFIVANKSFVSGLTQGAVKS